MDCSFAKVPACKAAMMDLSSDVAHQAKLSAALRKTEGVTRRCTRDDPPAY